MKFLEFFALVSVAFAAPHSRKVFHEHFEEFLDVIDLYAGRDITQIMAKYAEFEEFTRSLDYLASPKFKGLIYEMESLPEFKAVTDYLESHGFDISYFIGLLNDMLENGFPQDLSRQGISISGRDFLSFTYDVIQVFPKEKLAELFDRKVAEDEGFKAAIGSLMTDEWQQLYSNLWQNEVFIAEVQALQDNGIDIGILLVEVIAIFGQN